MSKITSGSCLCQSIRYQFEGPEFVFQYCHCSRCRKTSGSAHASNIIIDPARFKWLSGEDMLGRFEPSEAKHFATSFCKECGSSMPWLAQSGGAVVIPAGTLDEDPGIRPSQNIFWKDRADWSENVESLPSYDELPPRPDKG